MDFLDFKPSGAIKVKPEYNFSFLEMEEGKTVIAAIRCSFDFLEMEQGRLLPLTAYNIKLCGNCGFPNATSNDYCQMCQMELCIFRNLELDKGPVKVKVTFPKSDKTVMCDQCGAFNEKGQYFCKDCAATLT